MIDFAAARDRLLRAARAEIADMRSDFDYRMQRQREADEDLARGLARPRDRVHDTGFRRTFSHYDTEPIPSSSREPWGSIALLAWGAYWIGLIWAVATGRLP